MYMYSCHLSGNIGSHLIKELGERDGERSLLYEEALKDNLNNPMSNLQILTNIDKQVIFNDKHTNRVILTHRVIFRWNHSPCLRIQQFL